MHYLVVGLGNPGRAYQKSRHNLGFEVLERIAEHGGISLKKNQFSAAVGTGFIEDRRVVLIKPMTYMNLSGESVGAASRYYKVPPERLAIVHDDIDLALGRVQLRCGGGHGGHRGLQSVLTALGQDDFVRVRLGIDRPTAQVDVADYVLTKLVPEEIPVIQQAIERAAGAVMLWLKDGLTTAMNRYNPWPLAEDNP